MYRTVLETDRDSSRQSFLNSFFVRYGPEATPTLGLGYITGNCVIPTHLLCRPRTLEVFELPLARILLELGTQIMCY